MKVKILFDCSSDNLKRSLNIILPLTLLVRKHIYPRSFYSQHQNRDSHSKSFCTKSGHRKALKKTPKLQYQYLGANSEFPILVSNNQKKLHFNTGNHFLKYYCTRLMTIPALPLKAFSSQLLGTQVFMALFFSHYAQQCMHYTTFRNATHCF